MRPYVRRVVADVVDNDKEEQFDEIEEFEFDDWVVTGFGANEHSGTDADESF